MRRLGFPKIRGIFLRGPDRGLPFGTGLLQCDVLLWGLGISLRTNTPKACQNQCPGTRDVLASKLFRQDLKPDLCMFFCETMYSEVVRPRRRLCGAAVEYVDRHACWSSVERKRSKPSETGLMPSR